MSHSESDFKDEAKCVDARELDQALADLMTWVAGVGDVNSTHDLKNPNLPAGYTYLWQFVSHDMVFHDLQDRAFRRSLPINRMAGTPSLDLDSLYGGGPQLRPELYEPTSGPLSGRVRMRLGQTDPKNNSRSRPLDVYRVPTDIAGANGAVTTVYEPLIADPRNADNLITLQLVVLFARLHNKIAAMLDASGSDTDFERVRRLTQHAYRSVILRDLLQRLLLPSAYERLFSREGGVREGSLEPFEAHIDELNRGFWLGSSRLGHSIIRNKYKLNAELHTSLQPVPLKELIQRNSFGDRGERLEDDWVIDWGFFFQKSDAQNAPQSTLAHRFLPRAERRLQNPDQFTFKAQGGYSGLLYLDLARGRVGNAPKPSKLSAILNTGSLLDPDTIAGWINRSLNWHLRRPTPSGSHERRAIERIEHVFTADQVDAIAENPPLVYYLLCEAAAQGEGGQRLGPIASMLTGIAFARAMKSADFPADDQEFREQLDEAVPEDMPSLIAFVESA